MQELFALHKKVQIGQVLSIRPWVLTAIFGQGFGDEVAEQPG
jgi:hypothetical protein